AQRLQNRVGAARHSARIGAGIAWHAAIAVRQAHQVRSMSDTRYLGRPTVRVDGRAKVTGAAKYAAEHNVAGLTHGFVVTATIAKGHIARIHTADALVIDGVLDVFTHEHRPKLAASDEKYGDEVAPSGSPFRPLYD